MITLHSTQKNRGRSAVKPAPAGETNHRTPPRSPRAPSAPTLDRSRPRTRPRRCTRARRRELEAVPRRTSAPRLRIVAVAGGVPRLSRLVFFFFPVSWLVGLGLFRGKECEGGIPRASASKAPPTAPTARPPAAPRSMPLEPLFFFFSFSPLSPP